MYVYKFSLMKQINDTDITCQTLGNMTKTNEILSILTYEEEEEAP